MKSPVRDVSCRWDAGMSQVFHIPGLPKWPSGTGILGCFLDFIQKNLHHIGLNKAQHNTIIGAECRPLQYFRQAEITPHLLFQCRVILLSGHFLPRRPPNHVDDAAALLTDHCAMHQSGIQLNVPLEVSK